MNIRIYQTAKNVESYILETYNGIPRGTSDKNTILLDPETQMQELIGFGGAFTEAAAYTYAKLSGEKQRKVIDAYFDLKTGLGYTLGRIAITSCDFSAGHFTYLMDDKTNLGGFAIEHDKKWVLPMIKAARNKLGKDIKLFAAPWSPPSWMKDNGDMAHGGHLLSKFYDAWAQYFVKSIRGYMQAGFPIFAVSTQNEPDAVQTWESCIYSGEQERDFIKNYLGPALEQAGLDTKITIWDHNRDIIEKRAAAVLCDPEAARYVWGTAFHWYVSEEFENVGRVHERFPEKHLIYTEGCIEGGVQLGSWDTGERYGRNIISDFNNWNEGVIDWNLIVNETGGPNHVGNFCDAPIVADTRTDTLTYNSSYYYIAHFSKFIRPGAVRIGCKSAEALLSTAFLNTDGSIAAVMQNESDDGINCCLKLRNSTHIVELAPHSITTAIWTNA